MKRENPEKYRRWRLVQMINYDLQGEKLDRNEVKELWPEIKDDIEPYARRFFEFMLWRKTYSLPINMRWWNASRTISQ